jgi:hypothetical protein
MNLLFSGVGGYCICHPNVAFKGSNVAHDPATISLGQNSAGAVVRFYKYLKCFQLTIFAQITTLLLDLSQLQY